MLIWVEGRLGEAEGGESMMAQAPSRKNRTGPAVQPEKTGTRPKHGSVSSKDRTSIQTVSNRMNRPVFG